MQYLLNPFDDALSSLQLQEAMGESQLSGAVHLLNFLCPSDLTGTFVPDVSGILASANYTYSFLFLDEDSESSGSGSESLRNMLAILRQSRMNRERDRDSESNTASSSSSSAAVQQRPPRAFIVYHGDQQLLIIT